MYFKLTNEPEIKQAFYHLCDFEDFSLPNWDRRKRSKDPENIEYVIFTIQSHEHGSLTRSIQEKFYLKKSPNADFVFDWHPMMKLLGPPSKSNSYSCYSCWFNEDGCDIRVYPERFKSNRKRLKKLSKLRPALTDDEISKKFVYGGCRLSVSMTKTPLIFDLDSSKEECMKFLKWMVKKSKT